MTSPSRRYRASETDVRPERQDKPRVVGSYCASETDFKPERQADKPLDSHRYATAQVKPTLSQKDKTSLESSVGSTLSRKDKPTVLESSVGYCASETDVKPERQADKPRVVGSYCASETEFKPERQEDRPRVVGLVVTTQVKPTLSQKDKISQASSRRYSANKTDV